MLARAYDVVSHGFHGRVSTMTEHADRWGERLPRRLGLWSTVAVLVGSTIGSGIFRTPAVIAGHVGDLVGFFAVWIVGGLVALAGALTLAELAACYPRSGGTYIYIREAFGKLPAFLFGWAQLLILRPASYGAISITSSEYLWRVFGSDGSAAFGLLPQLSVAQATAAGMIAFVALINMRGIILGAVLQNLSTVLKVAALVALIVLGLLFAPTLGSGAPPETSGTFGGFGLALIAVLWAYDGWSDAGFVSGEVRDPQRALPRAFILGTAGVVLLYLLANLVYVRVVTLAGMPGSDLVAADVASALFGPIGVTMISAAVMVSTFGTLNGTMMTGPRVFYAMAEDRLLPGQLAAIHPRHHSPAAAIALSMFLGIVFVSLRSFAELAEHFVVGIWPFYVLAVAAVFVLRKREPDRERAYRTWGYPVVPALFLLASVGLLGSYAINQPGTFALNLGIIASGIPVYFAARRLAK